MEATITLGLWFIPLVLTIIAFIVAAWAGSGSHGQIGGAVVGLVTYGSAIIFSLIVWLLWALVA